MIADLAGHLTSRDRRLVDLLGEHQVMTTGQIAAALFPSTGRARQRLLLLYRAGALQRFRPWTPAGSAPWHWLLTTAAATHITTGGECGEVVRRADQVARLACSPQLGHTIGCHDLFVGLLATARTTGGCALEAWWSTRRCAAHFGDLARPDAYGRWHARGRAVDWFYEYDTGTEPLTKVAAKLDGYDALREASGIATTVLFHLPSAARENHLAPLLAGGYGGPVATTHAHLAAADGAAGPIWRIAGTATATDGVSQRMALIDLAGQGRS